ncbi:MAG: hypothetical protein HYU27_00485 [Acidobacteria bacterium]|nr:hypothetical protein [Acidobacteriota bacterium]
MTASSHLQFDARLVEETVLLQISGHSEERNFRRTRDRIYEIEDLEEREKRFREFHGQWFQRLQFDRPFVEALDEQPVLREKTRLCAVTPAMSRKDEGADLHGPGVRKPVIVLKLRPGALLDKANLLPFLRHELMHVVDMLDPHFAYEPLLPQSGLGSGHDNLVRERYRELWDAWITGRLDRRGWTEPGARLKRWTPFAKTFAFLGAAAQAAFDGVYDSDSQTHRAFVELASNPAVTLDGRSCPLCRFPAHRLAAGGNLPPAVLDEILASHPGWQPEHGLCVQCADLYRARSDETFSSAGL